MTQLNSQTSRGRILVVDDDALFRESVSTNLSDAGFLTDVVRNGHEAIHYLSGNPKVDLVLLDWNLPGMTGIEVMRRLRADNIEAAIIFLTVLKEQIYEEAGLLGGAVDFVEKSRSFSILLRRIELALEYATSRATNIGKSGVMQHEDLTLRHDSRRAYWKDMNVGLTLTEFNIVDCLLQNVDRDVSYREIYDIVHGPGFRAGDGESGYRTNVRAFIRRIRQKFRDLDPEFSHIKNYPGFGYRWCEGPDN